MNFLLLIVFVFLGLAGIILAVLALYNLLIWCVSQIFGISVGDARTRVQTFLNTCLNRSQISTAFTVSNDVMFMSSLREVVSTYSILNPDISCDDSNYNSGVPYYAIQFSPKTDDDKAIFCNITTKLIQDSLRRNNIFSKDFRAPVLVNDKQVYGYPGVEFRYPTNKEELEIVRKVLDFEKDLDLKNTGIVVVDEELEAELRGINL